MNNRARCPTNHYVLGPLTLNLRPAERLCKFIDDCDDAFITLLNSDINYAQAFMKHKNGATVSSYEKVIENAAYLSAINKRKVKHWVDHSSSTANLGNVFERGTKFSAVVVDDIKDGGRIFDEISDLTGVSKGKLSQYKVFTEVPITTSGGFMKADAVLVLKDRNGVIKDIIIVENKLSPNTGFTIRQNELWNAAKGGKTSLTLKYGDMGFSAGKSLGVIKEKKIIKVAGDGRKDDIVTATVSKIIN